MVKFIATKRTSKSLSVEEFWDIKDKMKPRKKETKKKQIQHDLSGRYRFKSFKKEVKKIDVSLAFYIDEIKVQPYSQTEDNLGSFFLDELEQQYAKFKAPQYKRFYNSVINVSQSLPLVLHNLDYIINQIMDNISLPEASNQDFSTNQKHKHLQEENEDSDDEMEEIEEEENKENQDQEVLADEVVGSSDILTKKGQGQGEEVDEDDDEEEDDEEEDEEIENKGPKVQGQEDEQQIKVRRKLMTPFMIQLLPELIRDCQHFGYRPFVDRIFLKITDLLSLTNLTLLQQIYKVLAYALKYFFPEILKDFSSFLSLYVKKLFLHHNRHVRQFSSESFCYVIKKMKQSERKDKISIIFSDVKEECQLLKEKNDKYSLLQIDYLKESISQVLFNCIVGIQKFISHRGMDQFKEVVQVIFDIGKDNEDILFIFDKYLSNSYQNFTILQQTDNLCYNLSHLVQVLAIILEKNIQSSKESQKEQNIIEEKSQIQQKGYEKILNVMCTSIIEFIDYKEGALIDSENVVSLVKMIDIMIEYNQNANHDSLHNNISRVIGRLFKRGFNQHEQHILSNSINEFLLNKLTIEQTLQFFKLLIFPYESKSDQVKEAYNFQEGIYQYCLVLAFQHIHVLFEDQEEADVQKEQKNQQKLNNLHQMFYMMTMIHKNSCIDKVLQLKSSSTLLQQALIKLPQLLDHCIENKKNKNICYRKVLLFTKISQFHQFNSNALIMMFEELVERINSYLKESNHELLITQDFPEDSYLTQQELYHISDSIVSKHELKSAEVNTKQKISLLKSEMLVMISKARGSKTSEQLIQSEIDSIQNYLSNPNYLHNIYLFLSNSQQQLTIKDQQQLFYQLAANTRDKYTETRLASLRLLSLFQVQQFEQIAPNPNDISISNSNAILKGDINLVQVLLNIQSTVVSIENERDIKMQLAKILTHLHAYPSEYHYLLFNFCLGYLFVRFSLLWAIVRELLTHLLVLNKHPNLSFILLNTISYYNYRLSPQFNALYSSSHLNKKLNQNSLDQIANLGEKDEDFFENLFCDDYLFEGDFIEEKLVFDNTFKALTDCKREKVTDSIRNQLVIMLQQFFENEHREISFKIANTEHMSELEIVCSHLDKRIVANQHLYTKYTHYLQTFINFIKIKDITQIKQPLYEIFLELLRKSKQNIQSLALECVLKYDKQSLHKYQASLRQMTKKENIRREMLSLNLDSDAGSIDDNYRKDLVVVMINILYPHLFSRKGTHNKSKKHSELQRNVIFEFFSSLKQSELQYLIELVFNNYHLPQFELGNVKTSIELQKELIQLHFSTLVQFNISLKNMIQKLGLLLSPFFNLIFNYLLTLFYSCQTLKAQSKSIKNQSSSSQLSIHSIDDSILSRVEVGVKRLQKQAIERYSQICRRYSSKLDHNDSFVDQFLTAMSFKLQQLRQDTVTSVPGVLKILSIWAEDSGFFKYFQKYDQLVPILISLYTRDQISYNVIQTVHRIFINLLGIQKQDDSSKKDDSNEEEIEAEDIEIEGEDDEEEEGDDDGEDDEEILSEDDQAQEKQKYTVSKKVIKTIKEKSDAQIKEQEKFKQFLIGHFQNILSSIYRYLEYNISPSALIKKNKLKKIDTLSLDIILFISNQMKEMDETITLNYINYFVLFLEAQNIKKLKDANPHKQQSFYKNTNASNSRKEAKMDLFFKLLNICNNFLKLNKDNTPFFKHFVSILPYTHQQQFKQQAVSCMQSLKLPFLDSELMSTLTKMSSYERNIQQSLDYDQLLDAVYQVNTTLMRTWLIEDADARNIQTYFMLLISNCGDAELSVRMAINGSFQQLFALITETQSSLNQSNKKIIQNLVFVILLPFISNELKKAKEEHVFKILLQILRLYLQFVPTIKETSFFEVDSSTYISLKPLIHSDEVQDFLEGVSHIQMSRRIKSILILQKSIVDIQDGTAIWNIILPILEYTILYKCQEIYKQSNKMKLTDTTLSHYKLLLQQAIQTVGIISQSLTIAKVKKIFKKYIQFLSTKKFDQKISIKIIGGILEKINLPFDIVQEVNQEMLNLSEKKLEGTLLFDMIEKNKEYDNPNQDIVENVDEIENQDNEDNNNHNEIQPYELILDEKLEVHENKKEKWVENVEKEKFYLKNEENALESIKGIDNDTLSYYKFLRMQVFLPMKQLLFDSYSKAYNKLAKVAIQDKQRDKSEDKIRTFMTIGLIRLLVKFPKEIFRIEFPKIINKVVKNLRTKDNDEREFTRKVLLEIVRITGPYFFHYILKELKFFLKEGWESHILNFTIYVLIVELDQKGIPIGSLDYCHAEIFPLLIDEIFGKLQEEKDLGFTKIPEQKKNKANATFQLLAKNLEFRNVITFLSFIRQQLIQNLDGQKNLGRFEEMFNFILDGLQKNKSVRHDELVTVSYSLIKDALDLIESSKIKERKHDTTISDVDNNGTIDKRKLKVHNLAKKYEILEVTAQNKSIFDSIQQSKKTNTFKIGCSLSNFGLKMCLMGIKKEVLIPEQLPAEENKEKKVTTASQLHFEQLIKVVVECLKSTDNSMVVSSLRILKVVISNKEAKSIRKATVAAVLGIMEKLSNTDIEMVGETFKLMDVIIEVSPHTLKNAQYKALLIYLKQFIELSDSCTEPLKVLKTIIEKKMIYEEVYDLVNGRVREMMLQSYANNVNVMCKSILLQFLVKYPISDAIMQSSINFLIKNTEYSYQSGRSTVYELLKQIVRSFPDKVITFFGEILFVSLLVNLIKEESKDIQELIKQTQALLIPRLSLEQKQRLIQNNLQWISQHANPKIQVCILIIQSITFFLQQTNCKKLTTNIQQFNKYHKSRIKIYSFIFFFSYLTSLILPFSTSIIIISHEFIFYFCILYVQKNQFKKFLVFQLYWIWEKNDNFKLICIFKVNMINQQVKRFLKQQKLIILKCFRKKYFSISEQRKKVERKNSKKIQHLIISKDYLRDLLFLF